MANELEIRLTLIDEATESLKRISSNLERFSVDINKIGRDVSQVGSTISIFSGSIIGSMILALKNASKVSEEFKDRFSRVSLAVSHFNVSIATSLLPLFDKFILMVEKATEVFDKLPRSLKDGVIQSVALTAAFGVVSGALIVVIGKTLQLVSNISALSGVFLSFVSLNPHLLVLVATFASLLILMLKFEGVANTIISSFEVIYRSANNSFLLMRAGFLSFVSAALDGLSKILHGLAQIPGAARGLTDIANGLLEASHQAQVFADRDLRSVHESSIKIGQIFKEGKGQWSSVFQETKTSVEELIESIKSVGDAVITTDTTIDQSAVTIQEGIDSIKSRIKTIPQVFGDAFGQALVYGKSFSDMLKESFKSMAASIISSIVQMTLKMIIFDKLLDTIMAKLDKSSKKKGFGGIFGGLVGSLFGPIGSALGGIAGNFFHNGGIIRAHSGLAVDEVPIIAQTGEGILSRRGMQALGGNAVLNNLNSGRGVGGGNTIQIYIQSAVMDSSQSIQRTAEELGFAVERSLRGARGI